MSKRLMLVLAVALVASLTCSAYAEVQNVKISGDITVLGIGRSKLTLREGLPLDTTLNAVAEHGKRISAGLAQTRVKVEADLTDNISTTVRLLNERIWGTTETNANTNIDLDLAYVTMKEFLYSPLTLSIGRQPLRYGNALIIGDPDTNGIMAGGHALTSTVPAVSAAGTLLPNSLDDLSLRKSFDAIKAVFNYDPLVIDLVTAKISDGAITSETDVNLYGINAAYAVDKDLNTDIYLFQRVRDYGLINTASGSTTAKKEALNTAGARLAYTGAKDLFLGFESAFQFGNHIATTALYPNEGRISDVSRKVSAYAIQAMLNYTLSDAKGTPALGVNYTYLSGDKYRSTSDNFKGWDPMYEDQAGGTLFNKILGFSNVQLFNVSGSLKPSDDVNFSLNYYYLMLNQPFTGTNAVVLSGVPNDPTYLMNTDKHDLCHEVDLGVTYDYTEDVQFGLTGGAFVPGHAFADANKDTAKQVMGSMKVTF